MKHEGKTEFLLNGIVMLSICILLAVMCLEAWNPVITGDETFSMKLAEHSCSDIVRLTAQDVHPPLYYFLLKAFIWVGELLSVPPVIAGKLTSVFPFFLLVILSAARFRKEILGGESTEQL